MRKATRLCAMAAGAAALMLALAQNAAAAVVATGGNATNITLDYVIHIFTNSATASNFTVTVGGDIEVLVVAGGGGGGSCMGGGGGAGGYIYSNAFPVIASSYAVTVGAGGAGAPAGVSQVRGYNGTNSVFGTLAATGGGGGASYYGDSSSPAGDGGSGGGSAGGANPAKGLGTSGQGNDGGVGGGNYYPAGGGGAGAAGVNSPGHGGVGITNAILGPNYYWAGGGGGSGYITDGGNGGNGGGGGGAVGITTGGSGLNNGSPGGGGSQVSQANSPGGNAGANTGGGGGGGSHYSANNNGGGGGSGIVVVRYPVDPAYPKIDNAAATNVLLYSAFLNGTLASTGASETAVSVYWGPADGAKDKSAWAHTNDFTGPFVPGQSLSTNIAGLTWSTLYYYRFYASNTAGEAWAPLTTNFTTFGPPVVNNGGGADQVGGYSARLRGQVTFGSPTPIAYICWGDNDPGVDSTGAWDTVISAGTQSGSFNQTVSGLAYNTQYFYRCYATNVSGETWASEVTNFTTAAATDKVWTGNGEWTSFANWTPNGQPGMADRVLIQSGSCLISASATIPSLLVSNSATLTFTNWNTKLTAGDVTILSGGNVTCAGPFINNAMSNRVYLAGSNITIDAGGQINVDLKGWAGGNGTLYTDGAGPGGGNKNYSGGGYGGRGGDAGGPGGLPYGSLEAPVDPGSGGGAEGTVGLLGGNGGGAVRLEAPTGQVTVNGTITANAGATGDSSGSGGGIYITCRTFAGTGGTVQAKSANNLNGGGGGGRIAVIYDASAQQGLAKPSVTFSVAKGTAGGYGNNDMGTLYFTDTTLLDENWLPHSGRVLWPGSSWNVNNLTVSNGWIRMAMDGLQIVVTNDLTVTASGRLDLGGNITVTNYLVGGADAVYTSTNGPNLNVGRDLIVTNGGILGIYAGNSNALSTYGATVTVARSVYIYTNSWIYPYSQPTNGGSVLFQVDDLYVTSPNGGINADGCGFRRGYASAIKGYGPGGGMNDSGGGYGGTGGWYSSSDYAGKTYGSSNAPVDPGSPGGGEGSWTMGGNGGGSVQIRAGKTVSVKGLISANGGFPNYAYGCGSGGGIYIRCKTFTGDANGVLRANGAGGAGYFTGGGGGRIAVWRIVDNSGGAVSAAAAAGLGPRLMDGTTGTVVWGTLPAPGTIIKFR